MSEGPVVDVITGEGIALEVRYDGGRVRLVLALSGEPGRIVELAPPRAARIAAALLRAAHLAKAQERDPP